MSQVDIFCETLPIMAEQSPGAHRSVRVPWIKRDAGEALTRSGCFLLLDQCKTGDLSP